MEENRRDGVGEDYADLSSFNPRFEDLYEDHRDQQHAYNLNGRLYVHNHNGGPDIYIGKAPDRRSLDGAGTYDDGSGRGRVAPMQEVMSRGSNRRRKDPGDPKKSAVRSAVVSFVIVLLVANAGTIFGSLDGTWDKIVSSIKNEFDSEGWNDADSDDGYTGVFHGRDSESQESQGQEVPLGSMYLAGETITLGETADTIKFWLDRADIEEATGVEPGESVDVDLSQPDGPELQGDIGVVTLTNYGDGDSKRLKDLTISAVESHNAYAYQDEDYEQYDIQETDGEIAGGVTMGISQKDAAERLGTYFPHVAQEDPDEYGIGGGVDAISDDYYCFVLVEDDRVNSIKLELHLPE